ncbi:MAG TPA: hypothetical protein VGC59_10475, partial [Solirubrobacteraceae bacterium]|jgi:hypothetical protein
MDVSLILAAAEHAAEKHHKSELPFFVAGGLLASFAVLISVFGFKKPDFPASEAAARGVMVLGTVLVASAMAMIIYVNA